MKLKFLQDLQSDTSDTKFDGHLRVLTKTELERYSQLHPDLQVLFNRSREQMFIEQSPLIHPTDIYLVCSHRGKEAQTQAVIGGFSKVYFPNSKHNKMPSEGLDTCPMVWNGSKYVIDWDNIAQFRYMNDVMMRTAKRLEDEGKIGHIIFGADFNDDGNLRNDKWCDLPHVQLGK